MNRGSKEVKWYGHGYREIIELMRLMSLNDVRYLCDQPSAVTTEFIDEFAYSRCYVLCEGLMIAGNRSRFPIRGVIISEYGIDLHYLNAFEIEGQTFYIDAYGLFDNILDVSRRYHIDETCMSIHEFDFDGLRCRTAETPVTVLHELLDALRREIGTPMDYVRFRDNACRHLLSNIHNAMN
ncbi:hypothetical protein AB4175_03900 [Vibrio cyclitrophicus]